MANTEVQSGLRFVVRNHDPNLYPVWTTSDMHYRVFTPVIHKRAIYDNYLLANAVYIYCTREYGPVFKICVLAPSCKM